MCVCVIGFNFSGPQFPRLSHGDALTLRDPLTLASQVTSALWPMDSAVHHLWSAGGDTSTTVSWLLLGLPRLVPVANVSAMLDGIVRRVYEVISIQVQGSPSPGSSPWGGGCRSRATIQQARGGLPHLQLILAQTGLKLQVLKQRF